MKIEPERVRVFAKLYEEEFEEEINEEQAEMMIKQCLELMKLMMEDLPGEGENDLEIDSQET